MERLNILKAHVVLATDFELTSTGPKLVMGIAFCIAA